MQAPWRSSRRALRAAIACVALLVVGCSSDDSTSAPEPGSLAVASGDQQHVAVGTTAPEPLVVTVLDKSGNALPGVTVTWEVQSGGGTLSAVESVTDATGMARVEYSAGTGSGPVVVSATVDGLDAVTFDESVIASAAASIEIVSGDAQAGTTGSLLTDPFVVKVTDGLGNPVESVVVTWATDGGGVFSAPTSVTDANGEASSVLTLGTTTGTRIITASINDGAQTVTFTATGS
jgi:hypothetical protein